MNFIKSFVMIAVIAFSTAYAGAVTDKEMEQAKAITAKEYLRWANDGSGYLDEFEVKSMSELESKLKAKEKDNLKAFKAVSVPSDYSKWDKEKLTEFWAVTFFTSPGLDEKGKGAKSRVKKKIQAMTVSAPAQESAADVSESAQTSPDALSETPATEENMPTADEAAEEQLDILNDQKAIENDARLAEESRRTEESHTWVYVLVLAILVGVVIWLVVYAANVMKRQPGADNDKNEADAGIREQAKAAIEKKNKEIEELKGRLEMEESRAAELGIELERLKVENSRLHQQVRKLKQESASEAPRKEAPSEIYLGRANKRGVFVRADRKFTPGSTVYRLETTDGMAGTFHVVDRPEVVELAMTNPSEYLEAGCTGEDLEDNAGVTRIVTESAGTAIQENGYWKVLRKTRIRYE